jgi:hypothetical protein
MTESPNAEREIAQKLGILAQLENCRAGIVTKISLSQRPKLRQLGVMRAQECEIAKLAASLQCPQQFIGDYQSYATGKSVR